MRSTAATTDPVRPNFSSNVGMRGAFPCPQSQTAFPGSFPAAALFRFTGWPEKSSREISMIVRRNSAPSPWGR